MAIHFLLISSVILILLRSSSGSLAAVSGVGGDGGKVSVVLYYEAMCPYCSAFITDTLADILRSGIAIDLRLVPFGNARVGADGSLACQHGPGECLLNTVEACALKSYPDTAQHFPFVYCVERLVRSGQEAQWQSCFQEAALSPDPVIYCYNSGHGQQLEVEYAIETQQLRPPHQYVPWVLVDGKPLRQDYMNLKAFVCDAYGDQRPKACEQPSRPRIDDEEAAKASKRDQVCEKLGAA